MEQAAYAGYKLLSQLQPREAQLLLSYIVWPDECPDVRVLRGYLDSRGGLLNGNRPALEPEPSDLPHAALSQAPGSR